MKRLGLIAVFCLLTDLVFAAPAYLDCFVVTEKGERSLFSLKIVEDTGKIDKTLKSGLKAGESTFFNGVFTPDKITFERYADEGPSSRLSRIWENYVLDRVDLSITQSGKWELIRSVIGEPLELLDGGAFLNTGSCSIVDMKDKKI